MREQEAHLELRPAAPRVSRFAWAIFAYSVAVSLFGAWVRITGAGAGCGSHWPTCNGEIVPTEAGTKTLIEFTHRATSGLLGLLVLALVAWIFKALPRGHLARRGVVVASIFLISEALLGAALVRFELVDQDRSVARAVVISLHLINTFSLNGFAALTAWWAGASGSVVLPPQPQRIGLRPPSPAAAGEEGGAAAPSSPLPYFVAVALVLVTSVFGAITALGDTLFPVAAGAGMIDRLGEELSAPEHFLVQLRVVHPLLAAAVSFYLLSLAARLRDGGSAPGQRLGTLIGGLTLVQLLVGVFNIGLSAPGWMQLTHLLLANLLWAALLVATAARPRSAA
jgi:heme A synthase